MKVCLPATDVVDPADWGWSLRNRSRLTVEPQAHCGRDSFVEDLIATVLSIACLGLVHLRTHFDDLPVTP